MVMVAGVGDGYCVGDGNCDGEMVMVMVTV